MALTCDNIIAKVRGILQDPYPGIRWGNDELEGWINAGQNSIASFVPGTTAVTDPDFPVRIGVEQQLPDGAARLIRIIGNVNHTLVSSSDVQRAGVIREASFDDLEITIPDWRTIVRKPNAGFQYYFYDVDSPLTFYLYPVPRSTWNGTGSAPMTAERLNLIYSAAPTPVLWRETGETGMIREIDSTQVTEKQATLDIPDVYESALIDYVLSRALQKAPHTADRMRLSEQREAAFLRAVQGVRATDEVVTNPDSDRPPNRGR